MAPEAARAASSRDSAAVLGRAVLRAAGRLGISQAALGRILGVSAASVSRLPRGRGVDPDSKEGELAALFVRLFRSLDAMVGGSDTAARAWFHASNAHLEGVPADLVQRVQGLVRVVEYLDALRGKV
jgi:transcriptional regulator with XRE-family HTH domain